MADTDKVEGIGMLTASYYLVFGCLEGTREKLGITFSPNSNLQGRADAFQGAGSGDILSIDATTNKYGKRQKQNEISTQIVSKTTSLITLNDSTTVNGKKRYKRVSVNFPHNCPVILQTKILNDYIKKPDVIRPFKGRLTWKRSPGGRYGIVEVQGSIIDTMMQEKADAKEAALAKSRESTTTSTSTVPREATEP